MSGEWEYDPYEYAEELAAGEDLGRSDLSRPDRTEDERGGMTRRELIARGGAGAAMVGGLGALAGPAAAARRLQRSRRERQVHRHVAGAQPRRRVPDPGHRKAGLQGSRLHGEADPRTVGEAAADRDHVARHVRRLRRLQLPVAAGLAVRRAPAARHAQAPSWAAQYKLFTHGKLNPASARVHVRPGQRAVPDDVRRSGRLHGAAARTPTARPATGRSSAGSARTASRSAGSRSRAGSSARRRTSTPTRWATTPT